MKYTSDQDVVLVSAARTPTGRFNGAFSGVAATELGGFAVAAAVARAGIAGALVDECLMGNVIGAGLGQAPARQAAIKGGLPETVGATAISKVCGSGLKAVILGAALIRAGDAQVIVAGGMENMTRGPHMLPQARSGYRLGNGELVDATVHDGLWCAFEQHHMGQSAEWIARSFNVSREAQDAVALQSHQRAVAAQDGGHFTQEIAPVELAAGKGKGITVVVDEPPRRDTDARQLAGLRPVFADEGSVTAGNAPGLSDGAAALVLMSGSRAAALGVRPLARIIGSAQAGVKPLELFTAPVFAVRRLLDRTSTTIDDYDLFEINEAFAAQVVANCRELSLDWDRVNVHGGAIALGHPIGASGARVLVTLLHALQARGGRRGLAALCLGGGEAVALAIELLP